MSTDIVLKYLTFIMLVNYVKFRCQKYIYEIYVMDIHVRKLLKMPYQMRLTTSYITLFKIVRLQMFLAKRISDVLKCKMSPSSLHK